MDNVLKEISKRITELTKEIHTSDKIYFSDNGYQAIPFSKSNLNTFQRNTSGVNIAYIDGGNKDILNSPDINVSLIRVHCSGFSNFDKKIFETRQFFCVTTIKNESEKMFYHSTIHQIGTKINELETEFKFKLNDETLKEGTFNGSIDKVSNAIRRFAELLFAKEIAESILKEGDIIVLDGTLQESYTFENEIITKLYDVGKTKSILITALSKTTNLFTTNGNSVFSVLKELSSDMKNQWYYSSAVKINNDSHKAEMYFTKLHKSSEFIFRFEIYNEQKLADIEKVLGYISLISQDPVFIGYPYGLIDADSNARVTEEETKIIKLRLKQTSKEANIKETELLAHSILDTIKF